ncbi:hypothetical protein ACQPZP_09555 [Spirillospora sp. CA-142024]|uniref:hypothetical protein n=1 Tax=Spirillospora sp. CA-142024 TaxID=3240036 RepID=UPI003D92B194
MKGILNLLTVVAATLIGGVSGSLITIKAEPGVVGTTEAVGFAVDGGARGAAIAIIASSSVVIFGKVARAVSLILGFMFLCVGCWMGALGHYHGAAVAIIGLSVLAGVLADFIARRADVDVSAAVTAKVQKPQSSGDSSQKQ